MKVGPVIMSAVVAASLFLATACGSGGAPAASTGSQQSNSQPTAAPASSGGGGGSAPTAAPASKASPTAASKPSTSGGGGNDLEKVSMPSGAKYDPYKPVKIGDVVDLPSSGLVLQVTGAKTADYDPQGDVLLVDLVLGNKSKEEVPVSSVLMMGAVTSDWRHYTLALDDLMQAAAKIAALNVKTFDTNLKPNEARKGTALIPIPKDAKALGFVFEPANFAANTSDPTVYVGLGIKGDFASPIIPENVEAFKAGTVYKVGQAAKAPKRNVAVQVNGARERTQSVPGLDINISDKIVLVDVTTRIFGSAQNVPDKEWSVTDSGGKSYNAGFINEVVMVEKGILYTSDHRRGLLTFKLPRDAKGLKLVYKPSNEEKIEFDLGTLAQSTSAPAAGPTPAGPKLAAASTLPDELKSLPMPTGFSVVEGSVQRSAPGGKFESADAQLFGKTSIKELASFYKLQLAARWESIEEDVETGSMQLMYMNRKDESLNLYVDAEQTDKGTTIDIRVEKN